MQPPCLSDETNVDVRRAMDKFQNILYPILHALYFESTTVSPTRYLLYLPNRQGLAPLFTGYPACFDSILLSEFPDEPLFSHYRPIQGTETYPTHV